MQVPFAVQFLFIFMTRRLLQGVLRLGGPLGPYWSNLKPNVDKSDICVTVPYPYRGSLRSEYFVKLTYAALSC